MKPIVNLEEVAFDDVEDNRCYTSKRGSISDHIGAKKLLIDSLSAAIPARGDPAPDHRPWNSAV